MTIKELRDTPRAQRLDDVPLASAIAEKDESARKGAMNASLQWLEPGQRVGILRVHPEGITFPGTFTWTVVVSDDDGAAHIHAAIRPPTKDERDAMRRALLAAGFSRLVWDRRDAKSGELRRATKVDYRTEASED